MHPFLEFLGEYKEDVVYVDAIPTRHSVIDDEILRMCSTIIFATGCQTAVLLCDGTVSWEITDKQKLVALYQEKHFSAVIAIPLDVANKLIVQH